MSIHKIMQKGGDAPLPQQIIALQQIVLGMFLVWDALGDEYNHKQLAEEAMLADWARQNGVNRKDAIQCLLLAKERFLESPWAHYIHCRNFNAEGWTQTLLFAPDGNADILAQIRLVMEARPFPEPQPEPQPEP